jgi:hypothetical protein
MIRAFKRRGRELVLEFERATSSRLRTHGLGSQFRSQPRTSLDTPRRTSTIAISVPACKSPCFYCAVHLFFVRCVLRILFCTLLCDRLVSTLSRPLILAARLPHALTVALARHARPLYS